jgi:hypothetical protein
MICPEKNITTARADEQTKDEVLASFSGNPLPSDGEYEGTGAPERESESDDLYEKKMFFARQTSGS